MTQQIHPYRSPMLKIHDALHVRGYRLLTTHPGAHESHVLSFTVYASPDGAILILQTFRDGGIELFRPVCETNSLDETIAAIP